MLNIKVTIIVWNIWREMRRSNCNIKQEQGRKERKERRKQARKGRKASKQARNEGRKGKEGSKQSIKQARLDRTGFFPSFVSNSVDVIQMGFL